MDIEGGVENKEDEVVGGKVEDMLKLRDKVVGREEGDVVAKLGAAAAASAGSNRSAETCQHHTWKLLQMLRTVPIPPCVWRNSNRVLREAQTACQRSYRL